MRIAILNWNNRQFGGTGTYLSAVMPALRNAGHEIALWHEVDTPSTHPVLPVPPATHVWSVAERGLEAAVSALQEWHPDILYAHGLVDPSVESRVLDVAPTVFFAHNYYGTCITGQKTFALPVVTPCDRKFGWTCLAEYYPRRCGGLSPVTMVRQFRLQQARLDLLSRYAAIVTHSSHMQREYIKHGLTPTKVFNVNYEAAIDSDACVNVARSEVQPWRLLFIGRMDRLKGGGELIEALPDVARRLGRTLHVTFAGDGPERQTWEERAAALRRVHPLIQVTFQGWVSRESVEELYSQSDLLVLPSLWPEPLSLVGLEAGRHRLPVVAFDVGGISDWLRPGVNGCLAPGDPPTVKGLADAIALALSDPRTHARLRHGAERCSTAFSFDAHLEQLLQVFARVLRVA